MPEVFPLLSVVTALRTNMCSVGSGMDGGAWARVAPASRRWCNGSHGGLKRLCPKGRVGSTPTRRTYAMTHRASVVNEVKALADAGYNASSIARITGVPRSTLRHWIGLTGQPPSPISIFCPICNSQAELDAAAYVYLL